MKTLIKSASLGLAVAATWAAPAAGCSVGPEYVRPTNFELVQLADAIVVATAVGQTSTETGPAVRFRIDHTIKGAPPATFVSRAGALGENKPSDDNLAASHPEGHAGPCNRWTVASGHPYVLFLQRQSTGEFIQAGYPFSRVNEDYGGEGSLWVRTVRTYVRVQQQYEPMAQLGALEKLLGELRTVPRTPQRQAQAQDIVDHLMSRSPYKPTGYLVATYEELERGAAPRYALRPRAADKENSEAQALTEVLMGGADDERAPSIEEQKLFILASLVNGDHPAALPLFDRLLEAPQLSPAKLGLAMRFLARNGQYPRAMTLIETRAMQMLALLSRSDAQLLIGSIADVQRGNWSESEERWLSDPHARAVWPEMALHLYWYQVDAFGPDRTIGFDAIDALKGGDFRARPMVTLALAGTFDSDVEAWAIAELTDEQKRRAWEATEPDEADDDPAYLPLQALIRGYGEERDAALEQAFCRSERRRELLIRALSKWGDDTDLAARIAATPHLSEDERTLLGRAAAHIFARKSRFDDGGWLSDGGEEYDLLRKIVRAEKLEAEPIRCKDTRR